MIDSYMNNLYTCDDCGVMLSLRGMNKRSHGGYDCPLCSGEISLTSMKEEFKGCLIVMEKEKLEKEK